MKIRVYNIYNQLKKTTSFWWLITPFFEKRWSGQLVYLGVRCFGLLLDFRGINNLQDFADAIGRPNIWHILRKFKRK